MASSLETATPNQTRIVCVASWEATRVWWAPPGYLLFLRDNNLVAQAFDDRRFEVSGDPFVVAEHVGNGFNRFTSDFSVSATGVLAWRSGFNGERQLAWFDRSGKQLAGLDSHERYLFPRLSPDGAEIAIINAEAFVRAGVTESHGMPAMSICLLDPLRGAVSAFAVGSVISPVWAPDGSRIVFGRSQGSGYGLYWKAVRGAGDEEVLLKTATLPSPRA